MLGKQDAHDECGTLARLAGLAATDWPPDACTLLGVAPGERDCARIERKVQERLAKLRCHQLSHPEEATEGMNRLAQAFVDLMDGCSDAKPSQADDAESAVSEETAIDRNTRLDWQSEPPPVRRSGPTPMLPPADNGKKPIPKALPAPNAKANTQMIRDLAQSLRQARAGLGTLDAVIRRIDETHRALTAWNEAGLWLREPKRQVAKPSDDQNLARRLDAVSESLRRFPAIVGQPGTPGYRVAAVARLQLNSLLVRGMDLPHRELFALDWRSGRNVLLEYRRFLLRHFKSLRRRGAVSRTLHARASVHQRPSLRTITYHRRALPASRFGCGRIGRVERRTRHASHRRCSATNIDAYLGSGPIVLNPTSKRDPFSGSLQTSIEPPRRWTMSRTTDRPIPVPRSLVVKNGS